MTNYLRIAYYFASLLRHVHWSRNRLEEYRNRKVREIVTYAYGHVPFYRRKFDSVGIKPENIRTVNDLNKVPVIRRAELQKNSDDLISDDFDPRNLRIVSTSGSTGRPLFTRITAGEDEFRKVKLLRANIICGQKPRDKWVVITAPQHEAHSLALQRYFGIYSPVPVSVFDDTLTQISKIERLRPDVLDGYSSSILLLAKRIEENGMHMIRPRMIVGGAELIDGSSRRYIEKVFDASFYDEYACVELERLAWQCEEKSEYHIDADTVALQFVDKEEDEVSAGETGEVVGTSLFNYAMPFIRYAVGDLGRPSKEDNVCECGRQFPLMQVVEGRKEELVFLPDGRVMSPLAIGDCMCAFKHFNSVLQYRFVQKRRDLFQVLVKKKKNETDEHAFAASLSTHLESVLGISGSLVQIEIVDEIPPDRSGKIRKVVSELNE